MAMVNDADVKQIQADVTEIKTLLKGYNGYPGLCQRHEDMASDYYKFKRWAIGLVAFAVGSGVLGLGIWNILGG